MYQYYIIIVITEIWSPQNLYYNMRINQQAGDDREEDSYTREYYYYNDKTIMSLIDRQIQ